MQLKPDSLVLVALVPAPADLEIARLLGWYRIPLRRAPKVIQVDFLALYQPGRFGSAGRRIEYIAPVLGHELATRGELLRGENDHPRIREEYFKLQLGPLQRLSRPILAGGWTRLTFLYTTGAYLLEARFLKDLVVRQEDREILWRSLRERRKGYASLSVPPPDLGLSRIELEKLVELLGSLDNYPGLKIGNDPGEPEET